VPSVWPVVEMPDRICTVSDSLRGVTILDCPGRRRSKSGWMSASLKFQARRAAVHDDAHAAAVRFAPRRDAEQLSRKLLAMG
jgi:hypothetical protein